VYGAGPTLRGVASARSHAASKFVRQRQLEDVNRWSRTKVFSSYGGVGKNEKGVEICLIYCEVCRRERSVWVEEASRGVHGSSLKRYVRFCLSSHRGQREAKISAMLCL
jgi:hypothetical protein